MGPFWARAGSAVKVKASRTAVIMRTSGSRLRYTHDRPRTTLILELRRTRLDANQTQPANAISNADQAWRLRPVRGHHEAAAVRQHDGADDREVRSGVGSCLRRQRLVALRTPGQVHAGTE